VSREVGVHCFVPGCIALCAPESLYCTVHRFHEEIASALGDTREPRRPVLERDANGLPARIWL
jgi:hypothetical protein